MVVYLRVVPGLDPEAAVVVYLGLPVFYPDPALRGLAVSAYAPPVAAVVLVVRLGLPAAAVVVRLLVVVVVYLVVVCRVPEAVGIAMLVLYGLP